ncbi:hypothetical protein Hamer_G002392 [Homarus americanus]|uniref:Uncharacterized protein n=1 Tax=Homarus americanus TaxID=6706 RepID=A0A8J5MYY3_HOMAM|nr:hypothetical protein Hamer_G002392 [Homarus americanus]
MILPEQEHLRRKIKMSTRAMRKLQGGRGDLDLPNSCPEEEDGEEEQEIEETQIVPPKGQNRFDLVS